MSSDKSVQNDITVVMIWERDENHVNKQLNIGLYLLLIIFISSLINRAQKPTDN